MVEFAMVLPLLVLILFGIVDFGLVLRDTIALRQGTREGARQGVVSTFGWDVGCPLTGGAASANAATKQLLCLTKDRIGLDESRVRVKLVLGPGGHAPGEPLLICAAFPLGSTTGAFSPVLDGRSFTTEVQMRIEEVSPASPLQATQETAVAGGDWSWCAL